MFKTGRLVYHVCWLERHLTPRSHTPEIIMRRFMPFLVPSGLSVLSASCITHDCTLMYAPDNLEVRFEPALNTAGAWEISVGGDLSATRAVRSRRPD